MPRLRTVLDTALDLVRANLMGIFGIRKYTFPTCCLTRICTSPNTITGLEGEQRRYITHTG